VLNISEVGEYIYWTFNTLQMRGLLIRDQFWKGHLAWFILQGSQGSSHLNSAGERNLWPSEQAYGHCLYLTDGEQNASNIALKYIHFLTPKPHYYRESRTKENVHIIYEISLWSDSYVVMYFVQSK